MSDKIVPVPETPKAPKKSIHAHAEKHGMKISVHDGDPYKLAHMMTALLHGWPSEEHHQGVVEMAEDDYLAAVAAAETGKIHPPANRRPR